jgi:thymidylate synthase (FAD)
MQKVIEIGKGHVAYSDHMGDDSSIAQAARASYKKGTKSVSDDAGLIRTLYRNEHFSPFSMCQLKLHFKLPMFVFNQLVRHDRFHWNVESGRYSEMSDDFWVPDDTEGLRGQGNGLNKQAGTGALEEDTAQEIEAQLIAHEQLTRTTYHYLLQLGLCREQARSIVSVGQYIECYATANLGDWLLMLSKRLDSNAQRENTIYAEAIFSIIKELWPVTAEAFIDYNLESVTFSRLEMEMLRAINYSFGADYKPPSREQLQSCFDMVGIASKRERIEFLHKIGLFKEVTNAN